MATYKLKGKVDANGQLVITEAIDLPPGDVEIIVLPTQQIANLKSHQTEYQTKIFRDLWETAQPVPNDFDADEARWEALKEKHNL